MYTAVGRFEKRSDRNGNKYPVIIVKQQENEVTVPEMICWTCLNWHIADKHQIQLLYEYKTKSTNDSSYNFSDAYVKRLEQCALTCQRKRKYRK